jgi:hypothetical protein
MALVSLKVWFRVSFGKNETIIGRVCLLHQKLMFAPDKKPHSINN